MKYEITVIDRDYRSLSECYIKYFDSKEDAEEYCDERSWSGEDYFCKLMTAEE